MKGIIIDGVISSGKTSILKIIRKKIEEEKPEMSKIFLSEHYTQRMLEHLRDNGNLDFYHRKEHILKKL